MIGGNIAYGYKGLVVNATTVVEEGFGDLAGNDQNNIPFAGNIVQNLDPDFDGTVNWVVFKAKQTQQDKEVFDWEEGLPRVKNPCTGIGSVVGGDGVCNIGSRGSVWGSGSYALS